MKRMSEMGIRELVRHLHGNRDEGYEAYIRVVRRWA